MSKQTQATGGIGFLGLLTIVFIVLKLTNFIDWSWWWVLLPLYAVPAFIFGGAILAGIVWFLWGLGEWVVKAIRNHFRSKRINRSKA